VTYFDHDTRSTRKAKSLKRMSGHDLKSCHTTQIWAIWLPLDKRIAEEL